MADELQLMHPFAAQDECERFFTTFGSEAGTHLGNYLQWKKEAEQKLDRYKDESSVWAQCLKAALHDSPLHDSSLQEEPTLDSSVYDPILLTPLEKDGTPVCCLAGKPILCIYPARMDFDLYPPELYTSCILLYCYKTFQGEPYTVLVDVRAGRNWPNMSVTRMYAWLRGCCAEISQYFPGGLSQCVVFPIPFVAKAVWYVVKPLLSEGIADSLVLVHGKGTSATTPLPEKEMAQYVKQEHLQMLEDKRVASFGPLKE